MVRSRSTLSRRDWRECVLLALIAAWILLAVWATPAQSAPVPLGTVSHLAWEASIRYNLPYGAADRLVCIAWYESRYDPTAVSPGRFYHGLMQFGYVLWRDEAPRLGYTPDISGSYDPYAAMDDAAYIVSVQQGGWYHWQPVVNGRC